VEILTAKTKTMKKILPVVLFMLIASSAFAKDIEGTWTTKVQGPDGDMELTFVFKMVDGKLTGVVKSQFGDTEITNTKVNGKEFSFNIPLPEMTIIYNCTLKTDDTINAKVSGTPSGDVELVLKRI
jgi:hypothetical protein